MARHNALRRTRGAARIHVRKRIAIFDVHLHSSGALPFGESSKSDSTSFGSSQLLTFRRAGRDEYITELWTLGKYLIESVDQLSFDNDSLRTGLLEDI